MSEPRRVLVTGVTGYVGGRLVPRLLEAGHAVRVLVRSPGKIADVPWRDEVEVVRGSLDDAATVARACAGIEVFYYLVHSMRGHADFARRELRMARVVAHAAETAGVRRFVYLGGLHPEGIELSPHMASRTAVGRVLLDSTVDAIVLQAGIVIGSGSASFEMIRHLADRLAVMPAPSWVRNRIEPVAVRDVLYYLVRAADVPGRVNGAFDIGSGEVLSYAEALRVFAEVAGLPRRHVLALPIPAPRLAGLWVGLVTPIPMSLARPLVESLQHDAVTRDRAIDGLIPPPAEGLSGYRLSVERALRRQRAGEAETSWAAAGGVARSESLLPSDPAWSGARMHVDDRTREAAVDPGRVWQVIEGIGGRRGWYSLPVAWRARGLMDKVAGGYGLHRGRIDPDRLHEGDPVDWWRVERVDRGRRLLLRAELKVPGNAWLELTVEPTERGSRYRQRALFSPRGLAGHAYWWLVYPFHRLVFPAMSRNVLRAAARRPRPAPSGP